MNTNIYIYYINIDINKYIIINIENRVITACYHIYNINIYTYTYIYIYSISFYELFNSNRWILKTIRY